MPLRREQVIFDACTLFHIGTATFYSGEIKKFHEHCDIFIPKVADAEFRLKRIKDLRKHYEQLSDTHKWTEGSIKRHIQDLYAGETEKYEIQIIDYPTDSKSRSELLQKLLDYAIYHKAPFSAEEKKGDNGFKDAFIYFTILDHLDQFDVPYVFVCTDDGRFISALKRHSRIKVIRNYGEFEKNSLSLKVNKISVDELVNYLGIDPASRIIVRHYEFNNKGNMVMHVSLRKGSTEGWLVEYDVNGREFSRSREVALVRDAFNAFRNSRSSARARNAISLLSEHTSLLSSSWVVEIERLAREREHIACLQDEKAVRDFFDDIKFNPEDANLEQEAIK